MKSYTLNLADGGECSEFFAESDCDAERVAADMLDQDDLVFADQWDADGVNDDDEACKRLLIWASEEDAQNDSGAKAIAQIETLGQA